MKIDHFYHFAFVSEASFSLKLSAFGQFGLVLEKDFVVYEYKEKFA